MPRPRASSGRSLTVLWALLVLFMQFSSNAKPVPRPQVIARDGDKAFDMPLEMQRRLDEEKGKKKKKNASNKTMVFGNETHLLRNLSATIGNGTMKYWDKTTIDPDTEEGMRLLRQLSAEASSSLDCEKDDDCSAGFACMMSGEKCGQQTGCKCSKIIRKVELPPDFIVAGFEPLMQLAPFAVTLEADPALNVRYTMDGTEPTRDSPAIRGGDSVAITEPQTILRAFTQANSKYSWKDSKETSAYYTVLVGRHGIGYLVPYYNALPGYSGKLVSVDLDSTRFNQLRVHGIRTDFANYYSEMLLIPNFKYGRMETFKAGTGAYMPAKEGQSAASGTDLKQLIIRDYSKDARQEVDAYGEPVPGNWTQRNMEDYRYDDYNGGALEDLKGYQGGFTATFSRRVLNFEERIDVGYDARKIVGDGCVKYDDGKANRKSTLLPWLTPELQASMYTKAPTPSNLDFAEERGDPPTPMPTIEVDYRDACTVTTSDDITSLVRNTTKVQEINYGFLVPFYNGVGYRGTAVRIEMSRTQRTYVETMYQRNTTVCCIPSRLMYWGIRSLELSLRDYCCVNETLNTSSTSHTYYTVDRFRDDSFADSSFKTLDFTKKPWGGTDADNPYKTLVGFAGGFSYGEWAYFVPFFDGYGYGHKVARVHIDRFDHDSLQMLDLWEVSTDLAGFFGGFSYLHQSKTNIGPDAEYTYGRAYGYLIPHRNTYGPVGKRNTRLTVDGYTNELVSEGRYSYGGDHLVVKYHGKFVRINLENEYLKTEDDWRRYAESNATLGPKCTYLGVEARGPACIVHPIFDTIDLSAYDPDLRGFSGGFVGGKYGYLAPYKNKIGNAGYFGKLVRIDLERFEVAGVLDLTQNDPSLVGFIGAFLHGNYGILVPHRNDPVSIDRTKGDANYFKHHGQLVRFDLSNELFVEGNFAEKVGNLILTNVSRMQVPDKADPMMRGYANGFACGNYIYLAPHFNNRFHGKFTRVDMRDFDYHVDNQFQCTSFQCGFSSVLSNDGTQYINLEDFDSQLVGFSGAFPGPGDTPLPVTLLTEGGGDRTSRKYGFKYQSSNAAYEYQKKLVGRVPQHPNMRFHINTTSIVVIGRRLGQICENLPDKYKDPDICRDVYDRNNMKLIDSGIDVRNSPYNIIERENAPTPFPTAAA